MTSLIDAIQVQLGHENFKVHSDDESLSFRFYHLNSLPKETSSETRSEKEEVSFNVNKPSDKKHVLLNWDVFDALVLIILTILWLYNIIFGLSGDDGLTMRMNKYVRENVGGIIFAIYLIPMMLFTLVGPFLYMILIHLRMQKGINIPLLLWRDIRDLSRFLYGLMVKFARRIFNLSQKTYTKKVAPFSKMCQVLELRADELCFSGPGLDGSPLSEVVPLESIRHISLDAHPLEESSQYALADYQSVSIQFQLREDKRLTVPVAFVHYQDISILEGIFKSVLDYL